MFEFNEMDAPQLHWVFSKKALLVGPEWNDCVLTSLDKFRPSSLLKNPKWSEIPRNQLKEKMTEFGEKKDEFKSVTVHFTEGGISRFLFFPEKIKAIDLHGELRKQFSSLLAEDVDAHLSFQISELKRELQENVISDIASLALLTHWKKPVFGKKAKEKKKKQKAFKIQIVTNIDGPVFKKLCDKGFALARANNMVRTLSSLPSNILNPKNYREFILKRGRNKKYTSQFLDTKKLKSMGAGAFLAVVQADPDTHSGIMHLKGGKRGAPKIAFVGKGLCFDTGGHNIKTGGHMFSMHRDMTGSALAFALLEMFVALKLPYEVHAYLAIAENLVSPSAYRPNDVIIALDGTSIEVVDTDAEGRMVLADTLALVRKENPQIVLDFATLTGAAVRALGTRRAVIFSNKPDLAKLGVFCGEKSGERTWDFPIGEEYLESIKSEYADILQCSASPGPDHIQAASFLKNFIGDDIPWIHMDLTTEENKGGLGLVGTDVTGFGTRWALELVQTYLKGK